MICLYYNYVWLELIINSNIASLLYYWFTCFMKENTMIQFFKQRHLHLTTVNNYKHLETVGDIIIGNLVL